MLSLTAYASAGAVDQLRASCSKAAEPAIAMPAPIAISVKSGGAVQTVSYLTNVRQDAIGRILRDFYSEGVTVANISLDADLDLPANPIVSGLATQYGGFTVMVSGLPKEMPGANWKTIKEYTVTDYEMLTAVAYLVESGKLRGKLLEITKQQSGFTIKVKVNPWVTDNTPTPDTFY
ncbi:MAG: hypothetical protein NTY45_10110 [Elusimicrobia bacterium]|nr:hypothetical protein [Elusimicrobiota bacterium]